MSTTRSTENLGSQTSPAGQTPRGQSVTTAGAEHIPHISIVYQRAHSCSRQKPGQRNTGKPSLRDQSDSITVHNGVRTVLLRSLQSPIAAGGRLAFLTAAAGAGHAGTGGVLQHSHVGRVEL